MARMARARDSLWLLKPVEPYPDGAAGLVTVDAPLAGEGTNDIQTVMLGWITCRRSLRTAIVLDFDADALPWADHHPNCERATQ